jgi:hypothetical protein
MVKGFTTQVVTLVWCFNTVGRKILTLGEGFTTQVVTLWCFNTVVIFGHDARVQPD